MKLIAKLLTILAIIIFSPCTVYGVTTAADLDYIWSKIATDICVAQDSYILVDPINCTPRCNFDGNPKKFCSEPSTTNAAYTCQNWVTSCDYLLSTTTSAAATTASTTASTSASTSAVPTTIATTTSAGTTVAAVPSVITSSAKPPTSVSVGSDPTPQMSESAKKWVGSGDSTAVNSKVPVAQKATKDYIDPKQCCALAKAGQCDTNKYYVRIVCANTCGSVGTDIYHAADGPSIPRTDCK